MTPNTLYKTKLTVADVGDMLDNEVSGYRIDNTRARALLCGIVEALRANPNAGLYIDVWRNRGEEDDELPPFDIQAAVVLPKNKSKRDELDTTSVR